MSLFKIWDSREKHKILVAWCILRRVISVHFKPFLMNLPSALDTPSPARSPCACDCSPSVGDTSGLLSCPALPSWETWGRSYCLSGPRSPHLLLMVLWFHRWNKNVSDVLDHMLAHSRCFTNVILFLRFMVLLTNKAPDRSAEWITNLPLTSSHWAPCLYPVISYLQFSEKELVRRFTNN